MIGWLQGIVKDKGTDYILLNVQGVGYQAFAHARLVHSAAIGDAMELTIETHVREDHIHLYGFADVTEREWFRALTNVERVGAKVALAILGTLTPSQMLTAIMAQDTSAFTQVSGVGAKMGERLIMELKDKALKLPVSGSISPASPAAAPTKPAAKGKKKSSASNADNAPDQGLLINDAASALTNLGYSRSEALTMVTQCLQEHEVGDLDALITLSLRKAN